jgi:hypothetical protein
VAPEGAAVFLEDGDGVVELVGRSIVAVKGGWQVGGVFGCIGAG